MISESLRKRISALNRRDLKGPFSNVSEVPESEPESESSAYGPSVSTLRHQELPDGVESSNPEGSFYRIEHSFQQLLHQKGGPFLRRYERILSSPTDQDNLSGIEGCKVEDFLFVDVEATGLTAGTPLFLVGALFHSSADLKIVQMFARDYTEEAALLHHFTDVLANKEVVISFNGKSYDLPYIRDRCIFHGVPFKLGCTHIDMLHEARRRWRTRLPNCKLQTLEKHICHRRRTGDIPGAEIPDAYHRYVHTGNVSQIHDILHHNALDLITLAELLVVVLEQGSRESSE
jgi:uncharacterized protein YprB with RNaseH-like and TPR domain